MNTMCINILCGNARLTKILQSLGICWQTHVKKQSKKHNKHLKDSINLLVNRHDYAIVLYYNLGFKIQESSRVSAVKIYSDGSHCSTDSYQRNGLPHRIGTISPSPSQDRKTPGYRLNTRALVHLICPLDAPQ